MIERFTERAQVQGHDSLEIVSDEAESPERARRFMKMVAIRKQQILEKILLETS